MFYPEGLVDFALEKSFIPKLPFFLLHRCVQKWIFAKYYPHFSFITLVVINLLIYKTSCRLWPTNWYYSSILFPFWDGKRISMVMKTGFSSGQSRKEQLFQCHKKQLILLSYAIMPKMWLELCMLNIDDVCSTAIVKIVFNFKIQNWVISKILKLKIGM